MSHNEIEFINSLNVKGVDVVLSEGTLSLLHDELLEPLLTLEMADVTSLEPGCNNNLEYIIKSELKVIKDVFNEEPERYRNELKLIGKIL